MTKLADEIAEYREELKRRPTGDNGRGNALFNLAVSLGNRFTETDDIEDVKDAIGHHREALALRPEGHPDRDWSLFGLAWCLQERYHKQGTLPDLEEAITLGRAASDLRPEGHPDRSYSLHFLATCFSTRCDKQVSVADLEEAITLGRAALKLRPPGHSHRALTLHNLGNDLRSRFLELGATADLDEAFSLHQSALDLHPEGHPHRSDSLCSLAICFSDRHNKQGAVTDLEEAITLGRAALKLHPPGHSHRAFTLHNLGNDLRSRFLELGATADLEEALLLHQSALDLRPEGHPDRSNSLHSLAACFSSRYSRQGSAADLEEAITLGRAVLKLRPPGHSHRALTLNNLGNDLRRRFLKLCATADLDEAILHHRSTLDLQPPGHSDRLMSLNQLVSCLGLRFEMLEAPTDLDELIALHRAILDLHPPDHKYHVKSIDELLCHLRKRGQNLGIIADLEECITFGYIALGLHNPGSSDYTTCFRHLISDLQSMLRNPENAFANPHSSSDRTMSLHNIVLCVGDVVTEGHVSTDMDEIVAVMRAVSKLCPPGHSVRIASLTTLTACFQRRFQNHGGITDLNEAIILCKEVLEQCPSGSPDSAPPLRKLAWCLSQRYIKLSTRADLEYAIRLEESAFTLYPPGHPGRAESLDSLSNYLQMRIKGRDTNPPSARPVSPDGSLQIKQLIRDVAFEVLKVSPPRLFYTRDGTLCDRNSQVSHFENSHEFSQLILSASTSGNSPTATHIRETVSTYFRYVTLSHRWGDSEPLLRNIEGRVIYDLDPTDGFSKLQSFCLASCRHGYLWAWSDTCCIDKESSAELQEAIGSMFSWYRESALTIVHLSDVSGTGTLTSSVWFKRGWTLQELLAPRFLLFFNRDWSLYRGISSNHKEDTIILGELEQATGIMARHLTDFYPSVEDARSRLQWASTRFTTRPEDISYSLFGVFGLHIPVLYGESVGNALGRLLAEVIAKSGDTSILDWVGQSSKFHSCFPSTIIPYQSLPSQPPDFTTPPNMPSTWNFLNLRSLRKMYQALSNLPLTQFTNFRLILPCIIHRIQTVVLPRVDTSTGGHVYHFRATGLESIEITLSQPLEDISENVVPYVLVRPWHFDFLGPSALWDAASAQWLTRMQQPFNALLLKELPRNEYKRVASTCHILARPTDVAGVLKGEVTTLTIV